MKQSQYLLAVQIPQKGSFMMMKPIINYNVCVVKRTKKKEEKNLLITMEILN